MYINGLISNNNNNGDKLRSAHFLSHGSVRPACISSRKAEKKGDFFSHISCVVFALHASAAEKPNRKVISSHIYPVFMIQSTNYSLFLEGSYRLEVPTHEAGD